MKIIRILFFLVCQVGAVWGGLQKEYRDFKDQQGHTVRGFVVHYNAEKREVSFYRKDRGVKKVPLTIFSHEDQNYILKEWASADIFLNEKALEISVKHIVKDPKEEEPKSGFISRTAIEHVFEIQIKNNSSLPLEKISMECCVYYEQDVSGRTKNRRLEEVSRRSSSIGKIDPTKTWKGKKSICIRKEKSSPGHCYTTGATADRDGEVSGIWVRVYIQLPSGKRLMRECVVPEDLKKTKKWMPKGEK